MASGLYALTITPSACARSCLRAAPNPTARKMWSAQNGVNAP